MECKTSIKITKLHIVDYIKSNTMNFYTDKMKKKIHKELWNGKELWKAWPY